MSLRAEPTCPRCGRPAHSSVTDCTAADVKAPGQQTPVTEGLQIGEHIVEDMIGAGGMGTVYRARHPATGEKVAIKVLGGMLARDAVAIRRFVLEAKAVNEIRHPNLANVFSFGQLTDGRYYYAMEYLDGCSLGTVLRARGRLRAEEVVPIFLDVLQALAAAHAKGIVHRDLKPDNVFLARSRGTAKLRAKLLDFGLAKLVAGESPTGANVAPLTEAGMAVGTPKYMAPEQCKAQQVDARTDLYAIGVILYESLTGKVPCDGRSTIEIWEAHVRKVPVNPRVLAPDLVSPPIDALIMKLLAKDPAARFQTASDVITVLSAHGRSLPVSTLALPDGGSAGASGSDVARALPSSVNSTHLVALDGSGRRGGGPSPAAPVASPAAVVASAAPAERPKVAEAAVRQTIATPPAAVAPSADTHGLRQILDENLELAVDEPAFKTGNPAQASALNIDLGVLRSEAPPAWATSTSGNLRRAGPRSALITGRAAGASYKVWLVFALAIAAAVVALITGR